MIEWKSGSKIFGFTTGAASGGAGASIRGQRADYIYIDEMDYLGDGDFDTVAMIAAERGDIGINIELSTPMCKYLYYYSNIAVYEKGRSDNMNDFDKEENKSRIIFNVPHAGNCMKN